MIKEILRSKSRIVIKGERPYEVKKYIADIQRAKNILKWKPIIDIKSGLKQLVEYAKINNYFNNK